MMVSPLGDFCLKPCLSSTADTWNRWCCSCCSLLNLISSLKCSHWYFSHFSTWSIQKWAFFVARSSPNLAFFCATLNSCTFNWKASFCLNLFHECGHFCSKFGSPWQIVSPHKVCWRGSELGSSSRDGIFSDIGSESYKFFIVLASITITTSLHHVLINRWQFLIWHWGNILEQDWSDALGWSLSDALTLPCRQHEVLHHLWIVIVGQNLPQPLRSNLVFLCLKPLINSLVHIMRPFWSVRSHLTFSLLSGATYFVHWESGCNVNPTKGGPRRIQKEELLNTCTSTVSGPLLRSWSPSSLNAAWMFILDWVGWCQIAPPPQWHQHRPVLAGWWKCMPIVPYFGWSHCHPNGPYQSADIGDSWIPVISRFFSGEGWSSEPPISENLSYSAVWGYPRGVGMCMKVEH